MGSPVVVTRGLGGCLWIFPLDAWQEMAQKLMAESIGSADRLALQRFFLGSAVEIPLDDQGRILLPQNLREQAGLQKDLVLVGMGNRLEIWARERWLDYNASLTDERIQELASEFRL